MAQETQECLKCGEKMEQGFVMDAAQGALLVSQWAAGPPKKSFWRGTKVSHESLIPIAAFRCDSCGYLEQYARAEFAAQ